jgi:hypothetical protein
VGDVTERYAVGYRSDEPLFTGLPKGHYKIHVLSTAEFRRKNGADLPEGVDCQGLDFEFTVDSAASKAVHLEMEKNEPIPSMRDRAARFRQIPLRAGR